MPISVEGDRRRRTWRLKFWCIGLLVTFLDTTLSMHIGGKSVMENARIRTCLEEFQSHSLGTTNINPISCILTYIPCSFVSSVSGLSQVVLSFINPLLVHGMHGCKENRLPTSSMIFPSRYQSRSTDGMHVEIASDMVDELEEVIWNQSVVQ